MHKWRYEDAVIVNRSEYEPVVRTKFGPRPIGILKSVKTETVFSRRECQRCGIKQGKRFAEDGQGKTPISGWEKAV